LDEKRTKSIEIAATPAQTWSALRYTMWPSLAGNGAHSPEWDDAKRTFSCASGKGGGSWSHLVKITATPSGSKVDWAVTIHDVGPLVVMVLNKKIKKAMDAAVEGLKACAEAEAVEEASSD